MLTDANVLLAWHRGLQALVEKEGPSDMRAQGEDDGSPPPTGDMRVAIQHVKARVSSTSSPAGGQLAACLDEMMTCLARADDEGQGRRRREDGVFRVSVRREDGGTLSGNAADGESTMRETAQCLREIPEDVARLKKLVEDATQELNVALGGVKSDGAEDGGLFEGLVGYAASLDSIAESMEVIDVVVRKLCGWEEGMTV